MEPPSPLGSSLWVIAELIQHLISIKSVLVHRARTQLDQWKRVKNLLMTYVQWENCATSLKSPWTYMDHYHWRERSPHQISRQYHRSYWQYSERVDIDSIWLYYNEETERSVWHALSHSFVPHMMVGANFPLLATFLYTRTAWASTRGLTTRYILKTLLNWWWFRAIVVRRLGKEGRQSKHLAIHNGWRSWLISVGTLGHLLSTLNMKPEAAFHSRRRVSYLLRKHPGKQCVSVWIAVWILVSCTILACSSPCCCTTPTANDFRKTTNDQCLLTG